MLVVVLENFTIRLTEQNNCRIIGAFPAQNANAPRTSTKDENNSYRRMNTGKRRRPHFPGLALKRPGSRASQNAQQPRSSTW